MASHARRTHSAKTVSAATIQAMLTERSRGPFTGSLNGEFRSIPFPGVRR